MQRKRIHELGLLSALVRVVRKNREIENMFKRIALMLVMAFSFGCIVWGEGLSASDYACFFQTDPEWSSYGFGKRNDTPIVMDTTIGDNIVYGGKTYYYGSGCSLLALTNAVATMLDLPQNSSALHNYYVYPTFLADYALSRGYRTTGAIDATALYSNWCKDYGAAYGISYVGKQSSFNSTVQNHMQAGGVAIINAPGHFMCCAVYDPSDGRYLILDSAPSGSRGTTNSPRGKRWVTLDVLQGDGKVSALNGVYLFNCSSPNCDLSGYLDIWNTDQGNNCNQTIHLRGWALDKTDYSKTVRVEAYVGGPYGSGSPCYSIEANGCRDDVNEVIGSTGNHGFDFVVPSGGGSIPIYVYAVNDEGFRQILEQGQASANVNSNSEIPSTLFYEAHLAERSWYSRQDGSLVLDGQEAGGADGLEVQAIRAYLRWNGMSGITYRAHVRDRGWTDWGHSSAVVGTTGQNLPIEAICFGLENGVERKYDIYYQVYIKGIGWTGWAKNGESAGSTGMALPITGYKIEIVAKDGTHPRDGLPLYTNGFGYSAHIANHGWLEPVPSGTVGSIGDSTPLQAILANFRVNNQSGITYRAHVRDRGWTSWMHSGEGAGTTGENRPIEAISMELENGMELQYDIYYRVYIHDVGWTGWASTGQDAGSTGHSLELDAYEVRFTPKGEEFEKTTIPVFFAENEAVDLTPRDDHSVRYDANGGTGAPTQQKKHYGEILEISTTKPTRTGYIFQGWASAADSETIEYAPGDQYTSENDILLYAVWKISILPEVPVLGTIEWALPSSIVEIEESAFENVPAKVVFVPDTCTGIGNYAFRDSDIKQIRIPSGCIISDTAFEGCESVQIFGTPGSAAEAFCEKHHNCTFVVE